MSQNALKLLSLSSAIFKRNERPPSFSSSGLHSICLLSIIIIIIIIIVFFFPRCFSLPRLAVTLFVDWFFSWSVLGRGIFAQI